MFLLASAAGCVMPGGDSLMPDAGRTLTGLEPSPSSLSIARETTQQFTAIGTFSDGSMQDVSALATWSVVDIAPATGVATITSTGLVTAKSIGQATVTATFMTLTATVTLTVTSATSNICSPDKWCWRNPLPHGNALLAVWGSDTKNIWTAGASGIMVKSDRASSRNY